MFIYLLNLALTLFPSLPSFFKVVGALFIDFRIKKWSIVTAQLWAICRIVPNLREFTGGHKETTAFSSFREK